MEIQRMSSFAGFAKRTDCITEKCPAGNRDMKE